MALLDFANARIELHLPRNTRRKIKVSELQSKDGTNGTDGINGREIELQAIPDFIQWRYASGGEWTNLIALNEDPTNKYKISDIDPTEGNSYFGYVDAGGQWYIMHLSDTGARYTKGDSGYVAAWADKENQNYDYFDVIF